MNAFFLNIRFEMLAFGYSIGASTSVNKRAELWGRIKLSCPPNEVVATRTPMGWLQFNIALCSIWLCADGIL